MAVDGFLGVYAHLVGVLDQGIVEGDPQKASLVGLEEVEVAPACL